MTQAVHRGWVLVAMSGALAMTFIDETGVGVALATIRHELHASRLGAHWVMNAYMLTLAMFVAAGGRLSDLIPTALAIISQSYPPEQRGRAVGTYIGAASVFYVIGSLLLITSAAQAGAPIGVAVVGAVIVAVSGSDDYTRAGFQAGFLACAAASGMIAALAFTLPRRRVNARSLQ